MTASNQIPENYRDLLEGPVVVTLITVTPENTPQGTPVWCLYDGTHVIVNSALGRKKDRNIETNKNVSVVAIDPQNPYRYLEVRGVIEEGTTEGAVDVINQMAKLYTGKDVYFGGVAPAEQAEQQTRITYKIKPTRIISQG